MDYPVGRHHNRVFCEGDVVTKIYEEEAGFKKELLAYEILTENDFPLARIVDVDYCKKMIAFKNEALNILHEFPDSEVRTTLIDLVNYSIDRKY